MCYPQVDNRFKPRMASNGLMTQDVPDGYLRADPPLPESECRRIENLKLAGAPSQIGKKASDV